MAKSKKDTEATTSGNVLSEDTLKEELGQQYQIAFDTLSNIRLTWDDKEAMLVNQSLDILSTTTKSQINDPRLSTIIFERACRVMAQLPTGKVQALTQADSGKNMLMNLILNKYIYPNASAQYDLLTKFRLWDIYSNVYGSFAMMVDYRIDDSYIGPDCYLVPMRNIFFQPGRISISECDYVFVKTTVSVGWLKKRNPKTWKNLKDLIEKAKEGGKNQSSQDVNKRTFIERNRFQYVPGGKGDSALLDLITRYERDRWVTFAPDYDNVIVRDIPNPQQNNRIPIVMKHCFPLLDSIIGLGEMERGKSLQYAINSLINLYMDGVKMSIFPPIIMDASGVIPSSIRFNPAAKWLVTKPNAISNFQFSPEGINTFQSTYSFLIAALLNMAGTTDTTTTSKTDPGLGKTPEALSMLNQRESSRDNWDRFMMEKAIEEVFNIMIDLVATKQEKPIEVDLFESEIREISSDYPDVAQMAKIYQSGKFGKLIVSKGKIGNTKYKFFIDSGTSMKQDDEMTNQVAMQLLNVLSNPAMQSSMMNSKTPKKVDIGELIEVIINTSGLPNANKIITEMSPEEVQQVQQTQAQQPKVPFESIKFSDLPPEGQLQMAQQAGLQLNPQSLMQMQALKNPQPQQAGLQQPAMPGQQPQDPSMGMVGGIPQPLQQPQVPMPQQVAQSFKDPNIAKMAQVIAGAHHGK